MAMLAGLALAPPARPNATRPDIVIVTVDTLRFDRLSFYGYPRPTSPNLDRLFASGVHFTEARMVEPLTAPSMCSMGTSLHPHEHGSSRNGLRMRPGLPSLATVLERRGYRTVAFVGNWTLRDKITGLGEHFDEYREVFTRKRYLVFGSETTAEDLTNDALEWIEYHRDGSHPRPFLLWVHYVEPHGPYDFHHKLAPALGIRARKDISASDRYDTEVAFVDRSIGRLLDGLRSMLRPPLIVFASDHGESLGEHDYWGHGRHLYEATLRIPLAVVWEVVIESREISANASILDVAPTLFGVVGWPVPPTFQGYDWSPVIRGEQPAPGDRVTSHQAHKGAVIGSDRDKARRKGLLEVARVSTGRKEILSLKSGERRLFDLARDRGEERTLANGDDPPTEELEAWLEQVRAGLSAADDLPPPSLDEESLEKLRALGYVD